MDFVGAVELHGSFSSLLVFILFYLSRSLVIYVFVVINHEKGEIVSI